jgi:hypothetical protein
MIVSSTDSNRRSRTILKSQLLAEIQAELHRHDFDSHVDEPPSVAQGGRGLVLPDRGRLP